jgi:hypothetical protein
MELEVLVQENCTLIHVIWNLLKIELHQTSAVTIGYQFKSSNPIVLMNF